MKSNNKIFKSKLIKPSKTIPSSQMELYFDSSELWEGIHISTFMEKINKFAESFNLDPNNVNIGFNSTGYDDYDIKAYWIIPEKPNPNYKQEMKVYEEELRIEQELFEKRQKLDLEYKEAMGKMRSIKQKIDEINQK